VCIYLEPNVVSIRMDIYLGIRVNISFIIPYLNMKVRSHTWAFF